MVRDRVNCKKLLVEIARREGELNLKESAHKAGPQVERYLTVFRQTIYEISGDSCFLDLSQGYDWCCAFVYYCCHRAGYEIPIRIALGEHHTLAAVNNWIKYVLKQNLWKEKEDHLPQAGDLVIFDKLLSHDLADHIGIVLNSDHNKMLIETAEGNVKGATGVFIRPVDETIRGYVGLPSSRLSDSYFE